MIAKFSLRTSAPQALISEQVCPEMLQYQEDLVKRLESQIEHQVSHKPSRFEWNCRQLLHFR